MTKENQIKRLQARLSHLESRTHINNENVKRKVLRKIAAASNT